MYDEKALRAALFGALRYFKFDGDFIFRKESELVRCGKKLPHNTWIHDMFAALFSELRVSGNYPEIWNRFFETPFENLVKGGRDDA